MEPRAIFTKYVPSDIMPETVVSLTQREIMDMVASHCRLPDYLNPEIVADAVWSAAYRLEKITAG